MGRLDVAALIPRQKQENRARAIFGGLTFDLDRLAAPAVRRCPGETKDGRPCKVPAKYLDKLGYCQWHHPAKQARRPTGTTVRPDPPATPEEAARRLARAAMARRQPRAKHGRFREPPEATIARAIELVADDELTDQEIADELGIGRRTLARWKKRPEFAADVSQRRAARWAQILDACARRRGAF